MVKLMMIFADILNQGRFGSIKGASEHRRIRLVQEMALNYHAFDIFN